MKIDIRWKGTQKSAALRDYVRHRARFAFRPMAIRLRKIVVRLEDVNGPRGGVDKRCTVEIVGPFGIRLVEARDDDFYAAADKALELAGRIAIRAQDRRSERPLASIRHRFAL